MHSNTNASINQSTNMLTVGVADSQFGWILHVLDDASAFNFSQLSFTD